jgi:hypothetical protein
MLRTYLLLTAAIGACLVSAPVAGAAECPSGWELGPTLRLTQSDGWSVSVGADGRTIGGSAVAMPPNKDVLWRGMGEGGSDGTTVAFGIGWDNGITTHYTGVIDQTTGAITGERPDGVTWRSAKSLQCTGAQDAPAAPAG